ncbi:MAG: tyrosine-type recombinase/integrase [Actinomycetales bacterium]|nr:tyrosine-type recombinase/integrase [Actinomycetales bacterium]
MGEAGRLSRRARPTRSRSNRRVALDAVQEIATCLRHSAATAMLEAGINLKAVSDLLGHTDIRMTFNTYGHVSDVTARAAMDALGRAMGYS